MISAGFGVSSNSPTRDMDWIPRVVNGKFIYSDPGRNRNGSPKGTLPQPNADGSVPGAKLKYSGDKIETVVQDNGDWDACFSATQCAASPRPEAYDCDWNNCPTWAGGRHRRAEYLADGITAIRQPEHIHPKELVGSYDCFVKEL